jgi:hypothetical protein
MRAPIHRLLSLAILLLWMAPGVGSLALAAHLLLDHHHEPGGAHIELADLLEAASHGHHHADAASDHEHPVRADGSTAIHRLSATPAALPIRWTAPVHRPAAHREGLRRPKPPELLFTLHCALLL